MNLCIYVMWTSVLPAFLCLHSWSCLLLCFLKAGMTPVMLAALKGHTDVVDMLVHKYNCSLTDVTNKVSAFDVLCCQSPVGVRCDMCTSVSLPSLVCRLSEVISIINMMWVSVFLVSLCAYLVVFHAVHAFPEDGHDTCDASSRQGSHWCCSHACI